jgi:hypothetical protein
LANFHFFAVLLVLSFHYPKEQVGYPKDAFDAPKLKQLVSEIAQRTCLFFFFSSTSDTILLKMV